MIIIKTYYIEKMDKHKFLWKKFEIQNDNIKIFCDLSKDKNIKKLLKIILKFDITNIVLDKQFLENEKLLNYLYSNDIKIFDGKWLKKYILLDILNYIIYRKNIAKPETEIAITLNEITDYSIEIIRIVAKQYKKLTIVTNHIEKLKKIEKELREKDGILIVVSNNKNKSLLKSQIVLNLDFNRELLNQYRIYDNSIIINLDDNIKIDALRFNGIIVNDYDIETGRKELIWRDNMKNFRTKDLLEANLYVKDNFKNIRRKIQKSNICIKQLYGINGILKL